VLALLLAAPLVQQPDPVYSGPQPGEGTPGFTVLALNGPDEGQRVDYVERWQGVPTLFVFIHEVTRASGRLVRRIDEYTETERDRVRTLLVSLNVDTLEGELTIPRTMKSLSIESRCGISVDGREGPGAWGLNKDVALTVVLAVENRVVANWALLDPNETDLAAIRAEIEKLPPGAAVPPEPKLETLEDLRAELLRQRKQILALQRQIQQLKRARLGRGAGRMEERGDRGTGRPGRGSREPERMDDEGGMERDHEQSRAPGPRRRRVARADRRRAPSTVLLIHPPILARVASALRRR